jgi:hypothetical protein
LALRFTLNQDIIAAIPPGDEHIFDMAMDLVSSPLPQLSSSELAALTKHVSTLEPVFRA